MTDKKLSASDVDLDAPAAYLQGPVGTIEGFDFDPTVAGIDVNNFDQAYFLKYLQTYLTKAGPEGLKRLAKTISTHVDNFQNPHHDTFADLNGDLLKDFLAKILPGVPPSREALFAFKASNEFMFSILPFTVARASAMNVIDRQGFLRYVDANVPAIDWSNGYPVIPCWGEKTQLIDEMTITENQNFTLKGTSYTYDTRTGIVPQNVTTQVCLVEDTTQNEHGFVYSDPTNLAIGSEYTFSIFVNPARRSGSFTLSTLSGRVAFAISTRTFLTPDSGVIGHINDLPNGWLRIGIQFIATSVADEVVFSYIRDEFATLDQYDSASYAYMGTTSKPIAYLYGPQVTTGPGMCPVIQPPDTLAASVVTIPAFETALPSSTGMLTFSYDAVPSLLTSRTESLMTAGSDFSATISGNTLTTTVGVTTPPTAFTADVAQGLQYYGLSYSLNALKFKHTGSTKSTVNISQSSATAVDTINALTFGSFSGGLHAASLYPIEDTTSMLEFLTQGN